MDFELCAYSISYLLTFVSWYSTTDVNNSCTEEKHQTPSEENAWGVTGGEV